MAFITTNWSLIVVNARIVWIMLPLPNVCGGCCNIGMAGTAILQIYISMSWSKGPARMCCRYRNRICKGRRCCLIKYRAGPQWCVSRSNKTMTCGTSRCTGRRICMSIVQINDTSFKGCEILMTAHTGVSIRNTTIVICLRHQQMNFRGCLIKPMASGTVCSWRRAW